MKYKNEFCGIFITNMSASCVCSVRHRISQNKVSGVSYEGVPCFYQNVRICKINLSEFTFCFPNNNLAFIHTAINRIWQCHCLYYQECLQREKEWRGIHLQNLHLTHNINIWIKLNTLQTKFKITIIINHFHWLFWKDSASCFMF